jgi:hypothetical protein
MRLQTPNKCLRCLLKYVSMAKLTNEHKYRHEHGSVSMSVCIFMSMFMYMFIFMFMFMFNSMCELCLFYVNRKLLVAFKKFIDVFR